MFKSIDENEINNNPLKILDEIPVLEKKTIVDNPEIFKSSMYNAEKYIYRRNKWLYWHTFKNILQ